MRALRPHDHIRHGALPRVEPELFEGDEDRVFDVSVCDGGDVGVYCVQ